MARTTWLRDDGEKGKTMAEEKDSKLESKGGQAEDEREFDQE